MESDSKGRRLGTQRNQIYPNFTPCLLLVRISFRLYLDFMAESKAQFISYNPCFWRSITALLKKNSTSSSTTTLSIVWAIAEQGGGVKRRIPVTDTTWQASATGNFVVLFNFYSFLQQHIKLSHSSSTNLSVLSPL